MRRPARAGRWAALPLLLVLLAGCGLPLADGVQRPGSAVSVGSPQAGDIRVLPPGPRADSTPEVFVEGFLAAQSSPDSAHAIAREFLAPDARWDDRAGLLVYDPATVELTALEPLNEGPGNVLTVVVTATITGEVRADGSYDATTRPLRESYGLRNGPTGLQLVGVPAGLRLAIADRDRSFTARDVFFLAPSYGLTSDTPNLVADRLFLPGSDNVAQVLVEHLLRGPSSALVGAVESAVPPGTRLLEPVTTLEGTTSVLLSGEAQSLDLARRAQLSAQLVWTLRQLGIQFQRLRLWSGGRLLELTRPGLSTPGLSAPGLSTQLPASPGVGAQDEGGLQGRASWAEYDPDGLAPGAPLHYIEGGLLRSGADALGDGTTRSSAATDGTLRLVEAAISPSGNQLALITADHQLWTGPRGGPFTQRLVGLGLTSPTWGGGEQGLWLLQRGRVVRVPDAGPVVAVPVVGGTDGPFTAMRISRDGVRVALVAHRRLWLGRIEVDGHGLRFAEVHEVKPGLADVAGVAWENGTTLVVLARFGTQLLLPVRVAVDGSTVLSAGRAGITSTPVSVAAAPGQPLVLGIVDGARHVLLSDDGLFFQAGPVGTAPFYPG